MMLHGVDFPAECLTGKGLLRQNRSLCQRQASLIIVVRSDRSADHPSSSRASVASATRIDGSPGRRPESLALIFVPVTADAVSITCRTEAPCPLARFTGTTS